MKIVKILTALMITLSLTSCASGKFDTNPPFSIRKATTEHWVGGIPGVSGIHVLVYVDDVKSLVLDKMYYKNRVTDIEVKEDKEGKPIIAGHYNTNTRHKIRLEKNPRREFGNKPEETTKDNFPFELKDTEAVISYKKNGKTKYFKVENLEEVKTKRFYR